MNQHRAKRFTKLAVKLKDSITSQCNVNYLNDNEKSQISIWI